MDMLTNQGAPLSFSVQEFLFGISLSRHVDQITGQVGELKIQPLLSPWRARGVGPVSSKSNPVFNLSGMESPSLRLSKGPP